MWTSRGWWIAVAIAACSYPRPAQVGDGGNGGDGGSAGCVDEDGDGWTTCDGDCCDNTTQCADPAAVNPGAFDVPGDGIDNDCDGHIDNLATMCDSGLGSASTDPGDFAKAIDLCQTTDAASRTWGLLSATYSHTDGSGAPNLYQHALLGGYGPNVPPRAGAALAVLATGHADTTTDQEGDAESGSDSAPFPADFLAANGGKLPNSAGCPAPGGTSAYDPIMVTLKIRVPTNAHSFSLETNFYSSEFPEYVCTPYNDFFVMLLDSTYSGSAANPVDKNLAFYSPNGGVTRYEEGVNLAAGNTGLFTQCVNGTLSCDGTTPSTITTCTSTAELVGTSFATAKPNECDANSLEGGATGWLASSGNVTPGETITLRIAIWNTSDPLLQSLVLLDNFQWSTRASAPGTIIVLDHQ